MSSVGGNLGGELLWLERGHEAGQTTHVPARACCNKEGKNSKNLRLFDCDIWSEERCYWSRTSNSVGVKVELQPFCFYCFTGSNLQTNFLPVRHTYETPTVHLPFVCVCVYVRTCVLPVFLLGETITQVFGSQSGIRSYNLVDNAYVPKGEKKETGQNENTAAQNYVKWL